MNPTHINDMDEYSLELIFRTLNVLDLRACSSVCLRWYLITRRFAKDQLVLSYAVPSFRVTSSSSKISQLINHIGNGIDNDIVGKETNDPNQESPYQISPIVLRINDNRILAAANKNFLRSIKTLIFCGNDHFQPDSSFSLQLLPDLVHLEIRDRLFCQFLIRSYLLKRFVCASVRYLVLENPAPNLLAAFPNLLYLEAHYLCGFQQPHAFTGSLTKLSHLILNCDKLNRFVHFFVANCGHLQHIDTKLDTNEPFSKMSLTYLLDNFPALKELNIHFHPSPVHSHQLAKLLATDFLRNSNVKITVHGIVLPIFSSYEQQLNYLNFLGAPFLVRPHPNCFIDFRFLKSFADHKKNSAEKISLVNKTIESAAVLQIGCLRDADLFNDLFGVRPFKKLNKLLIYDYDSADSTHLTTRLDTIQLMRCLPSTVRCIRLQFNYPIGQAVLDLLPICFPWLQELDLIELGGVAYKLKFLSALRYLASLRLHFILIEDVQHLLDAIMDSRYLTQLFFVTSPATGSALGQQLRDQFLNLKMNSNRMKINFMLNGVDGLQRSTESLERLI